MNRIAQTVSLFKEGFECSQAVLSPFSDLFGLDQKTALKIAQPFGAGTARSGGVCGAVNGALIVLGLKYGRIHAEDIQAREKTYTLAQEFIKRFTSLHGTIMCKELLGHDISTPEGYRTIEEKKLFDTVCPKLVQSAAEILEETL